MMEKMIYNHMCEGVDLKAWREAEKQTLTVFIYIIPKVGISMVGTK